MSEHPGVCHSLTAAPIEGYSPLHLMTIRHHVEEADFGVIKHLTGQDLTCKKIMPGSGTAITTSSHLLLF